MNKVLAGFAAILLFHSVAIAAPHIFKSKPEPIEKVGAPLQVRMAMRSGHLMRAIGSYPTTTVDILFLRVQFQGELNPANAGTTGSGLWLDPLYSQGTAMPVNADDLNDPSNFWIQQSKDHFIEYWNEVSYGLLRVAVDISRKVYQLNYSMVHYGNESNAALENLIYDSITAAENDTDPLTKPVFADYDAILIVHAGTGEESDTAGDTSNDIWSLYYANNCISPNASGVGCLATTLKNGQPITEAIIMPQTDSQDGIVVDPLGVYVHEFGHWLGLPDLYCTGLVCIPDGVGKWSLMGDGIYTADPATPDIFGSSPVHLDAWSKIFLGWVTPQTTVPPTDQGNIVFNPVELSPDIVQVQASTSTPSQYFLIENRQQTGFDKGLPGHGLLIWLIDAAIVDLNLPANTINNNKYRPGVKVVEADYDWNLLSYGCSGADDCGSAGDPFPGSTNNTALTPHSDPASLPYTASAWVNIKNIMETGPDPAVTTISADIGFSPLAPGMLSMYTNVLTWPANAETDIAAYQVYKNGSLIAATGTTSFADATARMGDVYQVTAVDTIGDESDFSGLVVANMERNDGSARGNPRCFIATAAYGSSLDPHVQALRDFRDSVLLKNAAGRAFVSFYERTSPPLAGYIGRHETARTMARWALTPIVYGIRYPMVFLLGCCGVLLIAVARYRHIKK